MSVVLVTIAASFFDDTGFLDCHASGASAQTSVRQVYACAGTKLDVGRVRVDGSVLLAVKPGFDATTQLWWTACLIPSDVALAWKARLGASTAGQPQERLADVVEEAKLP